MAAVVALMAKDKGGPKIAFQALMWPVTDADFDTPSYQEFADGYFLTRNMMIWFWDSYLTDRARRGEKYASPLRAAPADLQGLPPALVQTAHSDVLRDEGEAYARKLDHAGVEVNRSALQRADPRLGPAQPDRHRPRSALGDLAGRERAAKAPEINGRRW